MQETEVQTEGERLRDDALKDAAKQKGEHAANCATEALRTAMAQSSSDGGRYFQFTYKTDLERDWFKSVMVAQFNLTVQRWLAEFA